MIRRQLQITTRTPDETRKQGKIIGKWIEHPLVIGLTGDLGSGKTVFVQGLAEGLEVPDQYYITSPTFTLINEYPGRLPLFHMDLYRLDSFDEVLDLGLDEFLFGDGISVVEWAEKALGAFPENHMLIQIQYIDDETRRLDEIAMAALESLNPEEVYHQVRDNHISMCGMLPAVMVLDALNRIKPLKKCERVGYATSADATGEKERVVGYAGMLFA